MAASKIFARLTNLPQPEPPEGRAKFVIGQGAQGGDGVDFITGGEIFSMSLTQVPQAQQISGIRGAWVDASAMAAGAGKNVIVQIDDQIFIFAAGSQGYLVCAISAQQPTITISAQGGAVGICYVHVFNYNPLFTGSGGGAAAPLASQSGGSGGGGGGGGGSGSGGYGGGLCFTSETLVISEWGARPISSLKVGDKIRTARGSLRAISSIERSAYSGPVFRLSKTARATANHLIWLGRWLRVGILGLDPEPYDGEVFNLETDAAETADEMLREDTEHSFQLECGIFAHNNRPYK
jgi:hypothetical protein